MNKFAPIAFTLLLSCGVALWFLASDSLNFHIKSQIKTIGAELTLKKVSVDSVTIRSYQGIGVINNFIINSSTSTTLSKKDSPEVSIASIDLVINRESLKKEVIIIDNLTINGLTASYIQLGTSTSLERLLATVKNNVHQLTLFKDNKQSSTQSEVQQQTPLPKIKISQVIIKPGLLYQVDENNTLISTEKLPIIEWQNLGSENGLSGEKIGIEIFEKLLIELATHSKKKISQATKTL